MSSWCRIIWRRPWGMPLEFCEGAISGMDEQGRLAIALIAAALPPKLDGIGDYTANVAAELAKSATVVLLGPKNYAPTPIPGIVIQPLTDFSRPFRLGSLTTYLETYQPDWLLHQYNPFSHGRWGLNVRLPLVMRAIQRQRKARIALMVHEPFVPVTSWKFAVMTIWQRWQFWMLGRSADVVFFSIDPWVRRFQPWFPGKPVRHLPVGSNLPRVPMSRGEAKHRLGIDPDRLVIGLFGGISAVRMPGLIASALRNAMETSHRVMLLYVGPDGAKLNAILNGLPFRNEGCLPGNEASILFAAMDIYLAPYVDGISTRRTTLMAALQHGIPTVGTSGEATDDILARNAERAFLLSGVNEPGAFEAHAGKLLNDVGLRASVGAEGQALYEREFSWPRIVKQLLSEFETASGIAAASHLEAV